MTIKQPLDSIEGQYKSISKLIPNQFSLNIREKYPTFINFIQHYYKWLEQDGNVLSEIYKLPEYFDVDKTKDEFLEYFSKELMPTLPNDIVADRRKLLKHIKQFYLAKGTSSAIEFLFRIIYNDIANVSYPGELVIRCSDGDWSKKTKIKTTSATSINIIGRKIFGKISGAVAIVDKVHVEKVDDIFYNVIELSNLSGFFSSGEVIETRDKLQTYNAIISGQLFKVELLNDSNNNPIGGSGYSVGENIPVIESSFKSAIIKVNTIDETTGAIKSVIVEESGYGYLNAFNILNVNDKGASIRCFIGGVFYEPGTYLTQRGLLSGTNVIQDSYKYQTYSYVVSSNISLTEYEGLLKSTAHPSGLLLLGNMILSTTVTSNTSMIAYDADITIN